MEVSAVQSLGIEESSATFEAANVEDDSESIARVWTIIQAPEGTLAAAQTRRPTFDLIPDASMRFEGTFDGFDAPGEYRVDVYALDSELNVSSVRQTTLVKGIVPSSVAGLVSNKDGPIEGATVSLMESGLPAQSTGPDGIYFYAGVAPGAYMLESSAPDHQSQTKSVSVTASTGAAVNFLMQSANGGGEGEGEGPCVGCCLSGGSASTSPFNMLGDGLVVLIAIGALVGQRGRWSANRLHRGTAWAPPRD